MSTIALVIWISARHGVGSPAVLAGAKASLALGLLRHLLIRPSYIVTLIRRRRCPERLLAAIRRIAPQPMALLRNTDAIV
jgi:hypothetical protein